MSRSQPITVLQVFSAGAFTRGAAKSMCTLAEELNKRPDVNVVVVLPKTRNEEIKRHLQASGVEVHSVVATTITHRSFDSTVRQACKQILQKIMKSIVSVTSQMSIERIGASRDIDLVHICDGVIDIGSDYALKHNIPLVWHYREYVEQDHNDIYDDKRRAFELFDCATAAIAVSDALRDYYAELLPHVPVYTVYNGIASLKEIDYSSKRFRRSFDGTYRLVFLSGIRATKGIFEILKALALLKQEGGHAFTLDVFGAKDERDYERYKNCVQELGLNECVTYHGWTQMDLSRIGYYDIELTCSQSEAFGRVTAEAMCARTLVIGSNTGGTVELLQHDRGILYEQGNVRSLVEALSKAMDDSRLRSRLEDNAYEYAREHFTIEQYAQSVYRLYCQVCCKGQSYE